jgi:ankyrin repeat protein
MVDTSDLVRAVFCGDVELVDMLFGSADDREKVMTFVVAVCENMPTMVKCLLAAGVNLSSTYGGMSFLMIASSAGYTDIVRDLIDAGADITAKTKDGKTALQLAAKNKHRDIVAILLSKTNELKN